MSLANLITALLDEITKHYVTGASALDKQMRFRINRTVEILNDYPELSNILLKGDPFGSQDPQPPTAQGDLPISSVNDSEGFDNSS